MLVYFDLAKLVLRFLVTLWKGAPPLRRDTVELNGVVKVESTAHSTKYATTVRMVQDTSTGYHIRTRLTQGRLD